MPALFDTTTDREYFRIRPWIEDAHTTMECAAEHCEYGGMIDPRQEIIRDDDRGGMHVDCVITQALDGEV